MGLLDAPGLSRQQGDGRYLPLSSNTAWSVFSSRPVKLGDAAGQTTVQSATTRLSDVAPWAAKAVRFVYVNWQNAFGSSESPGYNGYRVKCAVHKGGASAPDRALLDSVFMGTFGNKEFGYVGSNAPYVLSDPIPVAIAAGERWFHEHYADTYIGSAPAAPTVTATSGGSGFAVSTTYYIAITYVFPDGSESLASPETAVTTSAGNLTLTVTSPTSVPGIAGYRCYYSSASGAVKYAIPSNPVTPLGTNTAITSAPSFNALYPLVRPGNVGLPVGRGLLADVGGVSLGENNIVGRDYSVLPVAWTGQGSYSTYFSPIGVLALPADGVTRDSVAIIGDSIAAGTGDSGYGGALGGAGFRAAGGQTIQMPYDKTKTPKLGFLTLAQGGETVTTFATAQGGTRRRMVSEHATAILDNYGTNDLGNGSALVYSPMLTILNYYAGRKLYFRLTLDPKTTSTDGFKTIAGQTISGTDAEADRRAINNCIRGTTAAVTISNEALFRSPTSGTAVAGDNLYSGGDGTAVKFFTAYPFVQGSEVIKVNAATQTVTTNYTYRGAAAINGIAYASGITFVSAPTNGATVTATYTKIPSFGSLTGYTGYFDTSSTIEVNGAGTAGTNGGFWAPATGSGTTGTATAAASTSVTDTSKAWTTDQWRGWCVRITADATTPASVGQLIGIQSNNGTVLTLANSFTTTPSVGASYEIIRPHTIDGVHNTSYGALLKSALIDTTKF